MRTAGYSLRWVAFVLTMGLLTGPAHSQERYGDLRGIVSDETGAVIPGISITLTHRDSNRTVSTSTGSYGDYVVSGAEPGSYGMRMELPGFEVAAFPDIDILPGQTLELDARIRISDVATTIEVTEVIPSIRPFGVAVVRNIPEEQFRLLPKTRSFQYLAATAAGVHTGALGGGIQINGATGAENRFLIDGTVTQSLVDGRSRQDVAFEYLDQVQIATSGVAAQYPGALGGIVSAATRSGGNEVHGEVHFFYDGAALTAKPVRRLVLDPVDDHTVGFVRDFEDTAHSLEGGFSLGGPILRDTLFFYTAWSPRRTRRERPYRLGNGTVPDTFERKENVRSGFGKLSFNPSPVARTSVSVLWTSTTSDGALAAFNGFGPNWDTRSQSGLAEARNRGFVQPQASVSGNLDLFPSRNVVLSARGNYFHDNYKDTGVSNTRSVEYRTSAIGVAGVPPELQQGVGFTNTPRVVRVQHDRTSRRSGNVDIAITLDRAGFHNFKSGYGIAKSINSVEAAFPGGGYVFVFWDASFTNGPAGRVDRGPFGYYEVHDAGTRGSAGALAQSAYAQDQWQIHPRLSLSLGVRFEHENIPSFRPDVRGNTLDLRFGWDQKIAPRLGASWDPSGDGMTRIYGSYGRYFDWNKYEWVRGALGGKFSTIRYRSLEGPDVLSLGGADTPGRDLWNPSVPDSFRDLGGIDFRRALDPELAPMAGSEYVVGVDYQWSPETIFGIRYTRTDLTRTIEDFARIVSGNALFTYGNPGEGLATANENPSTATPPFPLPRPRRSYDGLDVTLTRRFSGGWFGNLSYTWSRLLGNYPGLANVDDVRTPTLGFGFPVSQQQESGIARPGGNTSLAWDLDEVLFDSNGNLDVTGPLPMDRPHALKFTGGYEHAWNRLGTTDVGTFFYLASGTPLSTRVNTTQRLSVFVNGRGDMGRTPVLSYSDLNVGHTIGITEGQTLRIELTMLNVFNQQTALHRFEHLNRGAGGSRDSSAIALGSVNLFDGYDYDALIASSPDANDAFDPRYGMDDFFQDGFEGRFGIKWTF